MSGTVIQDVRYGLRILRRNPWASAAAVLTLAIGIGLSTTLFSVINAVLLRPLPFDDPEGLVMIFEDNPAEGWNHIGTSPPNFLDYRAQNQVFEHLAAFTDETVNLTGDGDPLRLSGFAVSADLFSLLGVEPRTGRGFIPEENQPGAEPVVILSNGLWQRRYGSDASLVGRSVTFDDRPVRVVGILPAEFRQPTASDLVEADFWIPITDELANENRKIHFLQLIARLKPGVTAERAQGDLNTIAQRLAQAYPDTNTGTQISIFPLGEEIIGNTRPALLTLFAATGFVLLIACVNVANLQLSRAMPRYKEFAVRMAIGCGRGRLSRQLLTEGLVLGLIAGILGALAAFWSTRFLIGLQPKDLPRLAEVSVDLRVLAFAFVLSLLVALLATLAPIFQMTKPALSHVLNQESGRSSDSRSRRYTRNLLVIFEIGLALLLFLGAGLLIRSLRNLEDVQPGFDSGNVLSMRISLPESKYEEDDQKRAFYGHLLERIEALPGVQSAGVTNLLPFRGFNVANFFIQETMPEKQPPIASYRVVNPGYFETMGISLKAGRLFNQFDRQDSPGVIIVDEGMSQQIWPDAEAPPVGKYVSLRSPQGPWLEIVGVVGSVRNHGLDKQPWRTMYVPYAQAPWLSVYLVVKTSSPPSQLVSPIVSEVWARDTNQPVYEIGTLDQILSETVSKPRFITLLLSIFAGIALVLAVFGIYSVMAYSVSQREREIGIRMALGAQKRRILTQVLTQGLKLALIGVVVGVVASFAATRTLKSMLFGVEASDPLTFIGLSIALIAVAALACYLPAWRACRVNPMSALRLD